jgi:hypothetical protein
LHLHFQDWFPLAAEAARRFSLPAESAIFNGLHRGKCGEWANGRAEKKGDFRVGNLVKDGLSEVCFCRLLPGMRAGEKERAPLVAGRGSLEID